MKSILEYITEGIKSTKRTISQAIKDICNHNIIKCDKLYTITNYSNYFSQNLMRQCCDLKSDDPYYKGYELYWLSFLGPCVFLDTKHTKPLNIGDFIVLFHNGTIAPCRAGHYVSKIVDKTSDFTEEGIIEFFKRNGINIRTKINPDNKKKFSNFESMAYNLKLQDFGYSDKDKLYLIQDYSKATTEDIAKTMKDNSKYCYPYIKRSCETVGVELPTVVKEYVEQRKNKRK